MRRILLIGVLLAGCVPADQMPITIDAGKYPDYHSLVEDVIAKRADGPDAPDGLKVKLMKCWADDTVASLTPAELDTLNRFARGERQLTTAQLNQINDEGPSRRPGRNQTDFDRLSATCPNDIPDFKRYFTLN